MTPTTLALLLALLAALSASAARPHILLVVLDDIGRADHGVYGKGNVPMPNLLKLGTEGAIMENFYTQPVCSPTRSSLLVGRYPFRMGMQHMTTQLPGMTAGIPYDTPVLPELLKKVGYDTHAIGKWHVGYSTFRHLPRGRGFNSYLGYLQGQGDYFKHNFAVYEKQDTVKRVIDGLDFWEDDKPLYSAVGNYSLDLYDRQLNKVVTNYAKQYDSKVKREDHPLFVYLAHQTVHVPMQPRKDEAEKCGHFKNHKYRRDHCSMLVELDVSLGNMVDLYKKHNLWDNTLLLLLTDNGGMTNFNTDPVPEGTLLVTQGSNFPLRAGKTTLFDGGVRSTALVSGGYIPKEHRGQRFTGLAHIVDFTATILAAAELFPQNREQLQLDGHDLMPLLTKSGLGVQRTEVPINIVNGGEWYSAVRFGKYKLIVKDHVSIMGMSMALATDWFDENGDLLESGGDVSELILLFDLEADVQERHDLSKQRPDLVEHGKQLIKSYVKSGDYMEPQDSAKGIHPEALPILHGGVWRPFQSEKQWQRTYEKQRAAAGLKRVTIPTLPHF